jgi:hypothetical protein
MIQEAHVRMGITVKDGLPSTDCSQLGLFDCTVRVSTAATFYVWFMEERASALSVVFFC